MAVRPYVFFDVDDTLVEWTISWAELFARVATEAGVPVTREETAAALNGAFSGLYQECIRRHAAAGDVHEFWLDYDGQILASLGVQRDLRQRTIRLLELFRQPGIVRLYPEVPEALEGLRAAGFKLGVVSGRPVAASDLERLGVRDYFDPVIDAFHAGSAKSEGRMFMLAAEIAAREGREAWHVGDNYEDDVRGARAAGIRPILIDRRETHLGADCPRITDLRSVIRMI